MVSHPSQTPLSERGIKGKPVRYAISVLDGLSGATRCDGDYPPIRGWESAISLNMSNVDSRRFHKWARFRLYRFHKWFRLDTHRFHRWNITLCHLCQPPLQGLQPCHLLVYPSPVLLSILYTAVWRNHAEFFACNGYTSGCLTSPTPAPLLNPYTPKSTRILPLQPSSHPLNEHWMTWSTMHTLKSHFLRVT